MQKYGQVYTPSTVDFQNHLKSYNQFLVLLLFCGPKSFFAKIMPDDSTSIQITSHSMKAKWYVVREEADGICVKSMCHFLILLRQLYISSIIF